MLRAAARPAFIIGTLVTLAFQQYTLQQHTDALMMQTAIILSQESQIRKMEQELKVMPHRPHAIPMPTPLFPDSSDYILRII